MDARNKINQLISELKNDNVQTILEELAKIADAVHKRKDFDRDLMFTSGLEYAPSLVSVLKNRRYNAKLSGAKATAKYETAVIKRIEKWKPLYVPYENANETILVQDVIPAVKKFRDRLPEPQKK